MQTSSGDHKVLRRSCRLRELQARKKEATSLEVASVPPPAKRCRTRLEDESDHLTLDV